MLESILYIFLGLVIGSVIVWLIQNTKVKLLQEKIFRAENDLKIAENLKGENEKLKIKLAEISKERESDKEKLEWLKKAENELREAFESLSAKVLRTNTSQFMEQANEQIDKLFKQLQGDWNTQKADLKNLFNPLNKELSELEKQVNEMEQKREGAYQSLLQQVFQLGQTQQQLQDATINLTHALKSSSVRGKWGEVQLRRIVEMAGLVPHVDFEEQSPTDTDKGRPDMVINLPNKGIIPVDSKVPMSAYLDSIKLDDEEIKKKKLLEHAKAMREHMKTLSQKAYWSQFERSPEFVVMVIPYESGLSAAFGVDDKLLDDALKNKVLVVSPVSLLALLKVVAYGWLQLQLSENAKQIAEQGKKLYSRLNTFSNYLQELGKKLDASVKAYNKAASSMQTRVIPAARQLKEMGAGTEEVQEIKSIETQARLLESQKSPDENI
jgi:DNA recombination protein RmuC